MDAGAWTQTIAGAALVLAAPGWLAVRPWRRRVDVLTLLALALPAGVLLVAVVSHALIPAGAALRWWVAAPLAAVLAGALAARREHPDPLARLRWPAPALVTALMIAVVVAGLAGYDAPPGDAANHAFMVRRVADAHTVSPAAVFAAPHGSPGFVYLMGWHAGAALAAAPLRAAPHLAATILPLACLALLPAALLLLWRRCGVATAAAAWGAVLVVANRGFPAGAMQWGAFGHAVGWLCVPVTALAALAALEEGGLRRGLLAGALLAGLLLVHATELPVLGVLVVCGWAARRRARHPARLHPGAALIALGVLVAAGAAVLAALGTTFAPAAPPAAGSPWRALGRALDEVNRAGWAWAPVRALVVAGVVIGLRRPVLRPLALASLAAGTLYVTLSAWRDPVSAALAAPFYREPSRVLALQLFLLPPLAGAALQAALDAARARGRALRIAAWAAALGAVVPGLADNARHVRGGAHAEPWGPGERAVAVALPGVVREDEVVANLPRDGSAWAWHASGVRFLSPTPWPLALPGEPPRRDSALGFLDDPWPAATLALRDQGVRYLWVGERRDQRYADILNRVPWSRTHFDPDPRFTLVLREGDASLYRIEWGGSAADH